MTVIFIILNIVLLLSGVSGTTLFAAPNGTSSTPCGGSAKSACSIFASFEQLAMTTTHNATIILAAGNYTCDAAASFLNANGTSAPQRVTLNGTLGVNIYQPCFMEFSNLESVVVRNVSFFGNVKSCYSPIYLRQVHSVSLDSVHMKDAGCRNKSLACHTFPRALTIDCNDENGTEVHVKQSSFIDNFACGRGGALLFDGSNTSSLHIDDCLFVGNVVIGFPDGRESSQPAIGGAIYMSGGALLSVSGTTFLNNTAVGTSVTDENTPASQGYAGALFILQTLNTSIIASEFSNNSAVGGDSAFTFPIRSAAKGAGAGGAILAQLNDKENSYVPTEFHWKVQDSVFHANYAAGGGTGNGGGDGRGGAFYLKAECWWLFRNDTQSSTYFLDIVNVTVTENRAIGGSVDPWSTFQAGASQGGGFYIEGDACLADARGLQVSIRDSRFDKNTARAGGGAMRQISMAGALYLEYLTLDVSNSIFSENLVACGTPESDSEVEYTWSMGNILGGALAAGASSVNVRDSTHFIGNRAYCDAAGLPVSALGSAVFIACAAFNVTDTVFALNKAQITNSPNGMTTGVVHIAANSALTCQFYSPPTFHTFTRAEFTSNTLSGDTSHYGGAIYLEENASLSNCTFSNNSLVGIDANGAHVGGAAIAVFGNTSIDGEFLRLENNSVYGSGGGGALYVDSSVINGTVKLSMSEFFHNSAIGMQKAPFFNASQDCVAMGGAILVSFRSRTILSLVAVQFVENVAECGGGMASFEYSDETAAKRYFLLFDRVHAFSNLALRYGGFSFASDPTDILSPCAFVGNEAKFGGGSFWTFSLEDPCLFANVSCDRNVAAYGRNVSGPIVSLQNVGSVPKCIFLGFKMSVRLHLLDSFTQVVAVPYMLAHSYSTNETIGTISFSSASPIVESDENGTFAFTTLMFFGEIGATAALTFESYTRTFHWYPVSTSCPPDTMYDEVDSSCIRCPAVAYSLNGTKCSSCPEREGLRSTENCMLLSVSHSDEFYHWNGREDYVLQILRGFQAFPLANPVSLLACDDQEMCKKGECFIFDDRNQTSLHCSNNCEKSRTDRACARCACGYSECYFAHGERCKVCPEFGIWIFAIVAVTAMVAVTVFTRKRFKTLAILIETTVVIAMLVFLPGEWWTLLMFLFIVVVAFMARKGEFELSGTIKVFIFWAQTTGSIVTHQHWPDVFHSFADKLTVISLRTFGIECVARYPFGISDFAVANRLLVYLLTPFLFILVGVLSAILKQCFSTTVSKIRARLARLRARQTRPGTHQNVPGVGSITDACPEDSSESLENVDSEPSGVPVAVLFSTIGHSSLDKFIRISVFILYTVYYEMANLVLPALEPCDRYGYMTKFRWVSCQSSTHLMIRIVGWFFFCVYVVGVPVLFTSILWKLKARDCREEDLMRYRFGFLYESFRPTRYWFELVWTVRRLLIAVSMSLLPVVFRTAVISLTLLLSATYMFYVRGARNGSPFLHDRDNSLELASSICLLYTFMVGSSGNMSSRGDAVIVSAFVILVNMMLVIAFLMVALRSMTNLLPARLRCLTQSLLPVRATSNESETEE